MEVCDGILPFTVIMLHHICLLYTGWNCSSLVEVLWPTSSDGPGQLSLREGQMVEIIDDSRGDWALVQTVDSAHLV